MQFEGASQGVPSTDGPSFGFFLLSLQRDVDATLAGLATLGFDDGVRRIEMPAPGGKTVATTVGWRYTALSIRMDRCNGYWLTGGPVLPNDEIADGQQDRHRHGHQRQHLKELGH